MGRGWDVGVLHPPAEQRLWAMASGCTVPGCHPRLAPGEGERQRVLWRGQRDWWVKVLAHKSGLLCTLLLALAGKRIYSVLSDIVM